MQTRWLAVSRRLAPPRSRRDAWRPVCRRSPIRSADSTRGSSHFKPTLCEPSEQGTVMDLTTPSPKEKSASVTLSPMLTPTPALSFSAVFVTEDQRRDRRSARATEDQGSATEDHRDLGSEDRRSGFLL